MRRKDAALVFGCASVLLSYPDGDIRGELAALGEPLASIANGAARARLNEARDRLAQLSPLQLATSYVDTFDLHHRRTLHLTYYRHGDTRERGMALSALAEAYRAAGAALVPGELPDFLPALLELAALSSAGAAVLGAHKAALGALRAELDESDSPYAGVVACVIDAVGGSSRADRDALRRYRAQGPPSERVGLEPFAPPEVVHVGITRR